MPLIIIGSLLMIIATGFAIPSLEAWLNDAGIAAYLWKGSDSSFGLIGLVASFGIAYSMTKQYGVDGVPSGIVSLSTFIVVTPFVTGEAGNGMPTTYMAAQGLFVAIILGLINDGYISGLLITIFRLRCRRVCRLQFQRVLVQFFRERH